MNKIKDRITLSILSGGIASFFGLTLDQIFLNNHLSKQSWPRAAASVWLSSKRQGNTIYGRIFGLFMTIGLCMLGAFQFINILTKYGRDKWLLKGLFFGISFNAIIHALLGGMVSGKIKPKDAKTNLGYSVSGALYGIVTALSAVTLGHDSLFDANAINDSSKPTEKTTEELKPLKPIAAK